MNDIKNDTISGRRHVAYLSYSISRDKNGNRIRKAAEESFFKITDYVKAYCSEVEGVIENVSDVLCDRANDLIKKVGNNVDLNQYHLLQYNTSLASHDYNYTRSWRWEKYVILIPVIIDIDRYTLFKRCNISIGEALLVSDIGNTRCLLMNYNLLLFMNSVSIESIINLYGGHKSLFVMNSHVYGDSVCNIKRITVHTKNNNDNDKTRCIIDNTKKEDVSKKIENTINNNKIDKPEQKLREVKSESNSVKNDIKNAITSYMKYVSDCYITKEDLKGKKEKTDKSDNEIEKIKREQKTVTQYDNAVVTIIDREQERIINIKIKK
jgi:hypothetical protein